MNLPRDPTQVDLAQANVFIRKNPKEFWIVDIPAEGEALKKWNQIEERDMLKIREEKEKFNIKFVKPPKMDFSEFKLKSKKQDQTNRNV